MQKKEPYKRVCVALPRRQLSELDELVIERSAAITLCVEYALKTGFMTRLKGAMIHGVPIDGTDPEPDEPQGPEEKYCEGCGLTWTTPEETCPVCDPEQYFEDTPAPIPDPFAAVDS
jgi:hypothetical protein